CSRYMTRSAEMTLERSRNAASVPSKSNRGESPRAILRPSLSFSRPFSKPSGSHFGFGISLIGVSAGASSASYSEPTSIDSPARPLLRAYHRPSPTLSFTGRMALQIARYLTPDDAL